MRNHLRSDVNELGLSQEPKPAHLFDALRTYMKGPESLLDTITPEDWQAMRMQWDKLKSFFPDKDNIELTHGSVGEMLLFVLLRETFKHVKHPALKDVALFAPGLYSKESILLSKRKKNNSYSLETIENGRNCNLMYQGQACKEQRTEFDCIAVANFDGTRIWAFDASTSYERLKNKLRMEKRNKSRLQTDRLNLHRNDVEIEKIHVLLDAMDHRYTRKKGGLHIIHVPCRYVVSQCATAAMRVMEYPRTPINRNLPVWAQRTSETLRAEQEFTVFKKHLAEVQAASSHYSSGATHGTLGSAMQFSTGGSPLPGQVRE
jgi:hypothetical protein